MSRTQQKKVLLVDAPDDRRLFCRFFQLHGFEVRECDTLEEAVPVICAFRPDLLVMDVARAAEPDAQRLRGQAERLPVLFHGTRISAWEAQVLPREGAAFLPTPFSLLDFHLTLQGLLDR